MNLFDPDRDVIAVYEKRQDGNNLFLTTCKLTLDEREHLISTNGNFVTDKILDQKNWVSGGIKTSPTITLSSPMDQDSYTNPGFTPINSFENDVMGISPTDESQSNNL